MFSLSHLNAVLSLAAVVFALCAVITCGSDRESVLMNLPWVYAKADMNFGAGDVEVTHHT
jgi:hypothetical protein